MVREPSRNALIHRSLSFVAAFGLVALGAGLTPDEVEAIETVEDPYVTGGAVPVPLEEEPVEAGTPIQYGPAELDDLVARIALYPDDLIAIVLPASTFPLQVVEAQRFLDRSKEGGSTTPDPAWDQSVVALLNYPDVVSLMNEDLEWMSRLGDAVVNQQQDVLSAVSRFRDRAYAAGNLRSDDKQIVSRPEEVIEIAPADPEVIYVPYYEPERVIVYQPAPVYYYYPRPYPVYYYSYPPDYFYAPYRPFWPHHFWGVSLVFNIGWHSHHLHVHDHGHWRPPHYGRPYYAWNHHRAHWRDDHWRGDRRWHHDDDRHEGWHDHEGDDWRDRNVAEDRGGRQQLASSSRKGQGKSTLARGRIELAAAPDTGKGRTQVAKPVGSAKPATSGKTAVTTKPGGPAGVTHAAKPANPGKAASAKPVSAPKPATTKGSSNTLARSTSGGRPADGADRAGSANGQDKGRSTARPSTQKPAHSGTQLASNASKYANGFASQPQSRTGTSQRPAPATKYMNGFASQPQSRPTQTWSTAGPEPRTSNREYSTRSNQDKRGSAPVSSAEPRQYSPQQASRPPPQAARAPTPPQTTRAAPPPQSRSQQASRAAPRRRPDRHRRRLRDRRRRRRNRRPRIPRRVTPAVPASARRARRSRRAAEAGTAARPAATEQQAQSARPVTVMCTS